MLCKSLCQIALEESGDRIQEKGEYKYIHVNKRGLMISFSSIPSYYNPTCLLPPCIYLYSLAH